MRIIIDDIAEERERQLIKWGEQNHPDGTSETFKREADRARNLCANAFESSKGTWRHILDEEVREAFAEEDELNLREELIQVAAVCVAWIEAIDRRNN